MRLVTMISWCWPGYDPACVMPVSRLSEWWPVNATGCYWAAKLPSQARHCSLLSTLGTGSFFVDRAHSATQSIRSQDLSR